VVALALLWSTSALAGRESRRKVPLVAVVSAVMLVAMSSEIVPIAYHINLTVAAGALVGPVLAPVVAFIVVLVLALLGHGGITVVGLNMLVITAEMAIGWGLFHLAARLLGRRRISAAAGVATVLTLALTTSMVVGIVWLGGTGAAVRETGALDPSTLKFSSPLAGGLFSQGLFSGGEKPAEKPSRGLSVRRFASVVFVLGPVGWLLEAFVTAFVLGYVAQVRPALLFGGPRPERRLSGDEAGGH
jgi:cobalt/nickel transport system permease protein